MTTPDEADQAYKSLNGDESVIPEGGYCYTTLSIERNAEGMPVMKAKNCQLAKNREMVIALCFKQRAIMGMTVTKVALRCYGIR